MKKIGILGHFGLGHNLANGQTVKTKNIYQALCNVYGINNISIFDTHGGLIFLTKMPFMLIKILVTCKSVVIMPAHKGICIITPLLLLFNIVFKRRIQYIVIGGWLPKMVSNKKWLLNLIKYYDNIYVETERIKKELEFLGLSNVAVMPNFKCLNIIKEAKEYTDSPLRICTFSRVNKEKGIEEAINAVKCINKQFGKTIFSLDIYGQIEEEKWFNKIIAEQPDYITYKGCVAQDKSTTILNKYFALLFPTYYKGECFAGTIIDAYSAGIPVFASDWHDNSFLIENMKTGLIFKARSTNSIKQALTYALQHIDKINNMRRNCIKEAVKYQPQNAIKILTTNIDKSLVQTN